MAKTIEYHRGQWFLWHAGRIVANGDELAARNWRQTGAVLDVQTAAILAMRTALGEA